MEALNNTISVKTPNRRSAERPAQRLASERVSTMGKTFRNMLYGAIVIGAAVLVYSALNCPPVGCEDFWGTVTKAAGNTAANSGVPEPFPGGGPGGIL